jgi:hypothetical protein
MSRTSPRQATGILASLLLASLELLRLGATDGAGSSGGLGPREEEGLVPS